MAPDAVRNLLVGKTWNCVSLFEREVSGDAPLTAVFGEDGAVSGSGGCNEFTGRYAMEGDEFAITDLSWGEKSCGPAANEQEFTYFSFLARVNAIKVEEDRLELFADEAAEPMTFTTGSGGGWLW